jgi:hypothetical protein
VTLAAYEYYSDDGTTYQVMLDSDFAAVLSYVPATGSEPYLPSYISMRYATYKSAAGILLNAVYVTSPFNPVNPPTFFEVGGISYFFVSAYGEQRGFAQNPTIVTIAGPPGPPGSGGGGGVTSLTAGSGISVSASTGAVTLSNTGVLSLAPTFSQTIMSWTSGLFSYAHGLGRLPYIAQAYLECTAAIFEYSVGDCVAIGAQITVYTSSGSNYQNGALLGFNATDIWINVDVNIGIFLGNKSSPAGASQATDANWNLVLVAF